MTREQSESGRFSFNQFYALSGLSYPAVSEIPEKPYPLPRLAPPRHVPRQEEAAAAFYAQSRDAFFLIDERRGWRVLEVNPAGCEWSGRSRADWLNTCLVALPLDALIEEGPLFGEAISLARLALAGEPQAFVWRLRLGPDSVLDVEANLTRVSENGRHILGVCLHDIRKERRSLHALEVLHRQLEIVDAYESMGLMASGLAHDINNTLGAIIGYTEMALEDPDLSERVRHDLEAGLKATHRAGETVRQLLMQTNARTAWPVMLSLRPLFKEVAKALRSLFPDTVELSRRFSCEGRVVARTQDIVTILRPMCMTAVRILGDRHGHVTLCLDEDETSVRIAVETSADEPFSAANRADAENEWNGGSSFTGVNPGLARDRAGQLNGDVSLAFDTPQSFRLTLRLPRPQGV